MVSMPQASDEPSSTSAAKMETFPFLSRFTERFMVMTMGGMLSSTVTVELHTEEFPLTSVTVRATNLGPASAQVKEEGDAEKDAIPHLSVDPPSILLPIMEAFPEPSSWIVIFLHTAMGEMVSRTSTVVGQELKLPFTSVTVSATLFTPTSAQVKDEGETARDAIPQLSVVPPSTS